MGADKNKENGACEYVYEVGVCILQELIACLTETKCHVGFVGLIRRGLK
jgi:hypothetical protein